MHDELDQGGTVDFTTVPVEQTGLRRALDAPMDRG
jgi:hypothetical protein